VCAAVLVLGASGGLGRGAERVLGRSQTVSFSVSPLSDISFESNCGCATVVIEIPGAGLVLGASGFDDFAGWWLLCSMELRARAVQSCVAVLVCALEFVLTLGFALSFRVAATFSVVLGVGIALGRAIALVPRFDSVLAD
jgi:hypothetical protein